MSNTISDISVGRRDARTERWAVSVLANTGGVNEMVKLMAKPTEFQKKMMMTSGLGQVLPQWYVEEMARMELAVHKLYWKTGVPIEDIMRFWMKTMYSFDDVCMVFSAHGIHAFEEYGIDRGEKE